MARVDRQTIRRVGRTAEWFIVEQIAKKVPASERFFLMYEVRGRQGTDPRVVRARRTHAVGRCIDEFIFVTVTRAQLVAVLGDEQWLGTHVPLAGELEEHEALCVAISDDASDPMLIRLAARAVNRRPSPAIIDR
jgi:hypothetical protein